MAGDWVRTELLGDLDGPVAAVDRAGTIAVLDTGWRLGWGVGAGDRWHVATEEAAVRTGLVDGMPVVATSMRVSGTDAQSGVGVSGMDVQSGMDLQSGVGVSGMDAQSGVGVSGTGVSGMDAQSGVGVSGMTARGGDVVQRVAAVRDASGRGVVVEFVNESAGPVSVALALTGSISTAQVQGSRLLVDGQVALELDRTPGGAVAVVHRDASNGDPSNGDPSNGDVSNGDIWHAVRSGPPAGDCEARSRSGLAAAAVLVPLAVGVPLRVTVPVAGGPVKARPPERVAAGWLGLVSRAASVTLPDETAERAWRRGVAACILAAGGDSVAAASRAAVVLDRVGLADEADRGREVILRAVEGSRLPADEAVAALRALASRRLRSGRVSGLAEWAGPLVDSAGGHLDTVTLAQVVAALEPEAPAAARDARRLLAEAPAPAPVTPSPPSDARVAAAVRDGVAFGGDGLAGIEALLDCLVTEAVDHVVMAPALPAAWRGASADALSIVTGHGTLSFSVRWHGARPALLWDLVKSTQRPSPPVALRCGLDESWTTSEPSGEALLAACAGE